jgi:hypothetical protein
MITPNDGKALNQADRTLSLRLLVSSMAVAGLPYGILTHTYVYPGYIAVLLSDVTGRNALIAAAVWEALGLWLLIREALNRKGFSRAFLVRLSAILMIFVMPFLLLAMLGPAALTIRQAFTF